MVFGIMEGVKLSLVMTSFVQFAILMEWQNLYVYLGMKKQRGKKCSNCKKQWKKSFFYETVYKICYCWWVYSKLICGINEV